MGMSRKKVALITGLSLSGVLMLLLGPVAICAYKQYSFATNVKVEIDVPSCIDTDSVPQVCRYLFSFEGERDPCSIQFAGSGSQPEYNQKDLTFRVTGDRGISHGNATIHNTSSNIYINNEALPIGRGLVRVLVKRDGAIVSGYCESRW